MEDQVRYEYLWIVASMLYRHVTRKMATIEDRLLRLDVDKGYPMGMCFLDGWTWYMTT